MLLPGLLSQFLECAHYGSRRVNVISCMYTLVFSW
jgi:hypothetical protein